MDASFRFHNIRSCRGVLFTAVAALFLLCCGCRNARKILSVDSLKDLRSVRSFVSLPVPDKDREPSKSTQDGSVATVSVTTAAEDAAFNTTASEATEKGALIQSPRLSPLTTGERPLEPVQPHRLNADDRGVAKLSLLDAMTMALEQNKYVRVQQYSPGLASSEISIEDSYFHPLFQIGGQYSSTTSQFANVVDGPGIGISSSSTSAFGVPQGFADQIRISQRTRSGGEVSAGLSSVYTFTDPSGSFLTLNPSFRSSATAEVSHPFFRGAGYDVAMTQVRIARDLSHAARCQLEMTLAKTAFETSTAYWDLVEARSRLDSRDQGVVEATAALSREEEKLRLGASSTPEVAAVREQLERFRVNRSLAEGDVANAERRLRTVMGISREDGARIIPISEPIVAPPDMEWDEAVDLLSARRAEIRLQNHILQSSFRRLQKAKNGLLPDIQGYAGVSATGTEDSFGQSFQTLSNANYGGWWAGVTYQKQLGRCADRGNHQKALLALAKQRASCVLTKDQILDELHAAHQSAMTAWRGVQMTESQQTAAAEVLKARREMHELGEISVQDYLLSLTQWNQSLTDQRTAVSSYNSALMTWLYAQGTILTCQDRFDDTHEAPEEFVQQPLIIQ